MAMSNRDICLTLDRIEADLKSMQNLLWCVRRTIQERTSEGKIGYQYDEQPQPSLGNAGIAQAVSTAASKAP